MVIFHQRRMKPENNTTKNPENLQSARVLFFYGNPLVSNVEKGNVFLENVRTAYDFMI